MTVLSLLIAAGCCLLVAGCESMDDSADVSVSSSTESTSTTVAIQLDDELLGVWSGLGEDGAEAVMFDTDGRMYFMSMAPEQGTIELVYRVEGATLIFGDVQGINEASAIYSVDGDVLTFTDPDTGEVTTYDRVLSATGELVSAQAILGRWELLDDQGYVDLEWEFYDDGTCRMGVWDPLTETYVYYNYEYEIEGDVLVFYDDEGVGSAAQAISIANDSLTMVNIFDPEASVTLQSAESVEGPTLSTEEMLLSNIVGVWAQAGEQAHHHGEEIPFSTFEFYEDGTCIQTVWDSEQKAYVVGGSGTYWIEGNTLVLIDEADGQDLAQRISIGINEAGAAILTMVNIEDPEFTATFIREE